MLSFSEKDYKSRIFVALRRVIRSVDLYSRDLNNQLGLTTPQLICLHAISRRENVTLKELTDAVNLSASTGNGIVDRQEAKQYLVRKRSEKDRRKTHLILTQAGLGIVSSSPVLLQDQLWTSLSQLEEGELQTITRSLERVVELMGNQRMDASPNLFPGTQVIKEDE